MPRTIGQRIRATRRQLVSDFGEPMSQKVLARLTKLQPSAVSHFETDRREPNIENLRRLCRALNCTSDYLIGLSGKERK